MTGDSLPCDEAAADCYVIGDWGKEWVSGHQKTVVLVKAGPGTGKTIIALNLMATLSRRGCSATKFIGFAPPSPSCTRHQAPTELPSR